MVAMWLSPFATNLATAGPIDVPAAIVRLGGAGVNAGLARLPPPQLVYPDRVLSGLVMTRGWREAAEYVP